ncbi:hypothetical protein U6G28_03890 [Actinomycetaceae bacterium MB13-C1-2]|nr:hypothetical protein U6G28_03890 [Actinomycetaceae bacterium MB13-C1-2]
MAATGGGWVRHLVTFAVASTFACATLTGFATTATATGDPATADAVPQSGSQVGEFTAQSGDQESAVTPQADLSTGKLTMECAEGSPVCALAWEVTIRASNLDEEGHEGLTGGQMTLSLSSAVYDVEVSLANQVIPQIGKRANGNFTTRQYGLPDMNTDEEIVVSLAGKIDRPDANQGEEQGGGAVAGSINDSDLTAGGTLPSEVLSGVDTKIQSDDEEPIYTEDAVIGAQVWITFDQAPREEPSLPAPAIPNAGASDLPSYDVQNPWGAGPWVGNSTCPAREDASAEVVGGYGSFEGEGQANGATKQGSSKNASVAETGSGSQCDQAWAQVEPLESVTPGVALQPQQDTQIAPRAAAMKVEKGVEWPLGCGGPTNPCTLKDTYLYDVDHDLATFTDIDVAAWITNTGDRGLTQVTFDDQTIEGIDNVRWQFCTGPNEQGGVHYPLDTLPHTFSGLVLSPGETLSCAGKLSMLEGSPDHQDLATFSAVPVGGGFVDGFDTFSASVEPGTPTAKFTVEKGIMEPVGSVNPALCQPGQFQTGNPNNCSINSGGDESPVALNPFEDNVISFRIKNTDDQVLTVNPLSDETVQGSSSITAISCYRPWPGGSQPVTLPAELAVNGTFVCTGTLKMSPGETHQNTVAVSVTGQTNGAEGTVTADFYAETPRPDLPALPVTGGLGTHIFVLTTGTLVAVALVLYAIKIKRGRVRPDGE